MALLLPVLRFWLLLLNVYSTFKAMKPPPQSQRSARTKSGPSSRAMQLRKRELKSCLAIWVVWSIFSTTEGVVDRTIGLVTPFYNELKCFIHLFLLVARAHGAEAVFLHVIHPSLRPYVRAIDDTLDNINTVFDLIFLLIMVPFEYISYRWHQRIWWIKSANSDGDQPPDDQDSGGGGAGATQEQRVLRPRNDSQTARMLNAHRQAQVILKGIDDAQDSVRTHVPAPPGNQRRRVGDSNPPAVGLRVRKRVLEHSNVQGRSHGPGSSSTRLHHVYNVINELPPPPSLQPFPTLPTPPTHPIAQSSNPLPVPPKPSDNAGSPRYQIWQPPPATFEEPNAFPRRPPSPIYPPIPSAYPMTPNLSECLPSPPRIIDPPPLVSPTPRRVSTGTSSSRLENTEILDKRTGKPKRQAPVRSARSAEPRASDLVLREAIEKQDLLGNTESQITQEENSDMDLRTISNEDISSNTNEQDKGGKRRASAGRRAHGEIIKGSERRSRTADSADRKGKGNASSEHLRRSPRKKGDRSLGVETDEFGFTVRRGATTRGNGGLTSNSAPSRVRSSSTGGPSTASFPMGPRKKALARTKPASRVEDESENSDEGSDKKKPRLNSRIDTIPEDVGLVAQAAAEDEWSFDDDDVGSSSVPQAGGGGGGARDDKKRKNATEEARVSKIPKQKDVMPTRTTRARTRQQQLSS